MDLFLKQQIYTNITYESLLTLMAIVVKVMKSWYLKGPIINEIPEVQPTISSGPLLVGLYWVFAFIFGQVLF